MAIYLIKDHEGNVINRINASEEFVQSQGYNYELYVPTQSVDNTPVITLDIDYLKSSKKAEVNSLANTKISSIEWKTTRLDDELLLKVAEADLTMSALEIAQERQGIRDLSNTLCDEIDALSNPEDVQSYKVLFNVN